jgi:hypothetical protein
VASEKALPIYKRMRKRVFISYRREGGYQTARHLFDLLSEEESFHVSFDFESLRGGNFDSQLLTLIDECTDFIIILNRGVFDRTINCELPRDEDWVRIELAYALEKGKNIIPIMLDGFEFPPDLPEDISALKEKNGLKYSADYFDAFYKKLKRDFLRTSVYYPFFTCGCTLIVLPLISISVYFFFRNPWHGLIASGISLAVFITIAAVAVWWDETKG